MSRYVNALNAVIGDCVRKTDIFIVTYPKSGSYWMQCLLGNALIVKQGEDRINAQSAHHYIPNLNDIGADEPMALWRYAKRSSPRVFVTHSPFDPRMLKGQVVYVLRDVRDVLVSYYYHERKMRRDFDASMSQYIRQNEYYPCAWDEHVRAWLLDRPETDRIHLVRYEQLRANTHGVFSDLLERLSVSFDDRDVERAVQQSSFDRLKQAERKYPSKLGPLEGQRHARPQREGGGLA